MHSEQITTVGWCSWYAQRTCSLLKFIFNNSPLLQQANTNSPVVFNTSALPMRLPARSSPLSLPRLESFLEHYYTHTEFGNVKKTKKMKKRREKTHTVVSVESNIFEPITPWILVQQHRSARKMSFTDTPESNVLSPARHQCGLIPRAKSNPGNVKVRNLSTHHRHWRPARRCVHA